MKLQPFSEKTGFESFKRFHSCRFRNEEGLDDDDDDDDAAAYSNQQQNVPSRQLSDGFNPLLQIFAAVSNALTKSVEKAALKNGAQLIGFTGNRETKGDIGGVGDNDLVTEHGNYSTLLSGTQQLGIGDKV